MAHLLCHFISTDAHFQLRCVVWQSSLSCVWAPCLAPREYSCHNCWRGTFLPHQLPQIAGHSTIIYWKPSISLSLPVYLFCINLLKQHVRNLFFWGKERDREGYPPWDVPHTQGLWELVACRSGLFELEWPEASPLPLGAMFQMAQPLPNK